MTLEKLMKMRGLSLIEVMVVIGIVAVLAVLAIPNYQNHNARVRMRAVAEGLMSDFNTARTEAMRSEADVYVNFTPGNTWCYGLSSPDPCDCNTSPSSCTLNNRQQTTSYTQYPGVSLATTLSNNRLQFGETRGLPANINIDSSSTITLTDSQDNSLLITISGSGVIRACSNQITGMAACP